MKNCNQNDNTELRDHGPEPFVFNINRASIINKNFRTTLWTGKDMQLTVMSIPVNSDIGVEMHSTGDQFIRIVDGRAKVFTGNSRENLSLNSYADKNYAVIIPAGTWHNIVNAGNRPLKLYSLYAPPQHAFGTVHKTKEEAEHEEH